MKALLLSLALLLPLLPGQPAAESATDREHQVKAVFLYNFAQFVEWPDSAFRDADTPLVVGILGLDPFETYLDEVVKGEKVNNHEILVKRFKRIEDVDYCHVLFVSDSEAPRLLQTLGVLKQRHILTVGESKAFSLQGGMVSFVTENGKIKLKVNLEAVQAAKLNVSSKLLRLAEIVKPDKE